MENYAAIAQLNNSLVSKCGHRGGLRGFTPLDPLNPLAADLPRPKRKFTPPFGPPGNHNVHRGKFSMQKCIISQIYTPFLTLAEAP